MPPARASARAGYQHAAAGRRGHALLRIVHPAEGKQHVEEEDKGGNQKALGEAFAAQLGHQRGENKFSRFRARHKPAKIVGRMRNIGVGEPEIIRRAFGVGARHALADGK